MEELEFKKVHESKDSLARPVPNFPSAPVYFSIYKELRTRRFLLPKVRSQLQELEDTLSLMTREFLTPGLHKEEGPPTACTLEQLFGVHDPAFWLESVDEIPNPVCKGKYFTFQVALRGGQFPPSEVLEVAVCLYTAEAVPKVIQHAMNGSNILKGRPTSVLAYDAARRQHVATFKIQVNEVTSHFKHGWVFLVVLPDKPSGFLRGRAVAPLIAPRLVVKAKEATCQRYRRRPSRI